jgi:hypothetical protein
MPHFSITERLCEAAAYELEAYTVYFSSSPE